VSRPARNDNLAPTQTFKTARGKLNEVLKVFSYVKVVEVTQVPPKDGRPSFYHGVGMTQSNSKFGGKSEQVFFDKGGRMRHSAFIEVGPCKLIDAAFGREHSSSFPQVGDILVGVLTDNLKPKCRITKLIRSWSRHGKIMMELSRMVEFGTHMSETEVRNILRQGESALAATALKKETQALSSMHLRNASGAVDDFWIVARMILWGNLRPLAVLHSMQTGAKCKTDISSAESEACKDIKISCSALDFITNAASRFEDPDIFKQFSELLEDPPPEPVPDIPAFDYAAPQYLAPPPQYGGGTSPPYQPYQPQSPIYAPEYDPTAYDPTKTAPMTEEYDPTKTAPLEYDPTKTEPPSGVDKAKDIVRSWSQHLTEPDDKIVLSPGYYERIAQLSKPVPTSPAPVVKEAVPEVRKLTGWGSSMPVLERNKGRDVSHHERGVE
jgi:hypothetical protein